MSMLVTTPALGYTVAPASRSPLSRGLWLSILAAAIPALLYQNSGFLQFGYRFSLDYIVFLVMLLAVGGRRFTWLFKAMVIFGIAVNLFGANHLRPIWRRLLVQRQLLPAWEQLDT